MESYQEFMKKRTVTTPTSPEAPTLPIRRGWELQVLGQVLEEAGRESEQDLGREGGAAGEGEG